MSKNLVNRPGHIFRLPPWGAFRGVTFCGRKGEHVLGQYRGCVVCRACVRAFRRAYRIPSPPVAA